MPTTEQPTQIHDRHIMHTYARQPVTFVRGEGAYLWDDDGKRYLDFLGGIAVNGVGHCHPQVVAAIQEQAATLIHTSNLYNTEPQNRLADALIATSNDDFQRIFFSNSGAEANECALKIARKHGKKFGPDKIKIVTATGSFHGRTMGTVTATAQPKYQEPFAPLVPGFQYVDFNDLDALQDAVDDSTCAVMLEPIQGESGINVASHEYLKYARMMCDAVGALLIFDEIQTGMGRTGEWWAYQLHGIVPDILTSAKSLGGGMPIGATLARGEAADTLVPGDHGSTFAGNLVCCAAALATLNVIESDDLRRNAAIVGDHLRRRLSHELREHLVEARGAGLMIGIQLKEPVAKQVLAVCLTRGLIVNAVGESIIRLLPPLIVTTEQADEAVGILQCVMGING